MSQAAPALIPGLKKQINIPALDLAKLFTQERNDWRALDRVEEWIQGSARSAGPGFRNCLRWSI